MKTVEFIVKIHNNTCYLLARGEDRIDFYFKKLTSFSIWPWTDTKAKIEKIRAKWLRDYQLVESYKQEEP